MAGLVTKISLSQSKDCKTISISDTTGVYNATTNIGGYNQPGGTYNFSTAISQIQGAWLKLTKPKATTSEALITINSTNAQSYANQLSTYSITNSNFGGSSSDKLIDGVYKAEYIPYFFGSSDDVEFTGISGNNYMVMNILSGTFPLDNITHIFVNNFLYEISSIAGNNIYFTTNLNNSFTVTSIDVLFGFSTTTYFGAKCQITKCLHSKIAKIDIEDCGCGCSGADSLCTPLALYSAIQPNIDLGKYTKAQDIIDYLTIYCGNDNCNC